MLKLVTWRLRDVVDLVGDWLVVSLGSSAQAQAINSNISMTY